MGEPEVARGHKVDNVPEGPPAKTSESPATAVSEAIPRSRYKAPPTELSTPSRPPPASNASPPLAKQEATPGGRVKAPPCYSGAAANAAASPAPSVGSTPSRVKAPPSSAKK